MKFPEIEVSKINEWHKMSSAQFIKLLNKSRKLSLKDESEWMIYFNQEQEKAIVLEESINNIDIKFNNSIYKAYSLTSEEIEIIKNY